MVQANAKIAWSPSFSSLRSASQYAVIAPFMRIVIGIDARPAIF